MPSALSLLYDPIWIQKHYDNMPLELLEECVSLRGWSESKTIDKLFSAYKRNPEYLQRFERLGRVGISKFEIPHQVVKYYQWIYAPLIKVNPQLENDLKEILFPTRGEELLCYYNVGDMHHGGTDRVYKMPPKSAYQLLVVDDTLYKKTSMIYPHDKSMVDEFQPAKGEEHLGLKKYIVDFYSIPFKEKPQKWMFKNTNGRIPIFMCDFNISNKFLNWVTNPFIKVIK